MNIARRKAAQTGMSAGRINISVVFTLTESGIPEIFNASELLRR